MPLTKDSGHTMVIAFLLWRVPLEETKSTINEWYSRMAEINHKPTNPKPMTVILAYEASEDQEERVNEFASKQGSVEPKFFCDAGEDGVMESLQECAEAAIERSNDKMLSPRFSSDNLTKKGAKKGCAGGCSTM